MSQGYTTAASGQYGEIRGGTDYFSTLYDTSVYASMNGYVETYYNSGYGMTCSYAIDEPLGSARFIHRSSGVSNNSGGSWGRVVQGD
jgi:murein DD-endopeptidase MepM/ murein hydrolase activator NlpD